MNISDLPRNSLGDLSHTFLIFATVLLFAFSVHRKVLFEVDFILRELKHRRPNGFNASKLQTNQGRLGVNYNHTSGLLSTKTVCFLSERVPCFIDFYQYKSNCSWILRPRKQFSLPCSDFAHECHAKINMHTQECLKPCSMDFCAALTEMRTQGNDELASLNTQLSYLVQ